MPAIAQKILALPLNTEEGEAQLLRLIAQDPLISAKLIGLANSPVHGLSRRVNAVADAAALFGISKVKAVAIGIASLSTMSKLPAGKNFKPQDLWIHSMVIAIAMQAIAKAMPPDLRPKEDQIFLAGLLHDMGYMALHFLDARLSDELHLQLRLQPDRPVLELERELLGITHCDIGAHLARHWNLPAEIVDVLGHHHPPLDAATDGQKLTSLIALAEKLQPNFGLIENTGTVIATHEWDALGINLADIEEIHSRVNETVIQLGQMGDVFR
ncbi:MAG: HDOD domain-containing protein [Nitrosomonadales bacterium]|nr:HDOD domain-containing protein [Nitrosomonadales bacterium]